MVITFFGQLLNLVLLPFILDAVGVQLYGTWAALATILSVGALVDAGIRTEVVRRVGAASGMRRLDLASEAVHDGTGVLLRVALPVVLLGVLGAPLIRAAVFDINIPGVETTALDWMIRAAFVLVGVSALARAHFSALAGLQRVDLEMYGYAVGLPIGSVASLVGARLGMGIWAFYLGAGLGLVAETFIHALLLRRVFPDLRFRPTWRGKAAVTKSFLTLSGLALLTQVSDIIDNQWDKLVITKLVGPSAVANFHLGTTIVRQVRAFVLMPLGPLLVAVAEGKSGKRETGDLASLISRATLSFASVLLPMVVILAAPFIRLWLGEGFGLAVQAAQLFSVAAYLNALSAPLAYVVLGLGMHRFAALSAGVNIVVNGVLSFFLTLEFGMRGALYGSIVGTACGSLLLAYLFVRMPDRPRQLLPVRAMSLGLGAAALAYAAGIDRVADSWVALAITACLYVGVVGAACLAAERLPVREVLSQVVKPGSADLQQPVRDMEP